MIITRYPTTYQKCQYVFITSKKSIYLFDSHSRHIQFFFNVTFGPPHRGTMRLSLNKSDKQKHKHNKFKTFKLFSCFCFPLHNIGITLFLVQHQVHKLANKCIIKFFFVSS